MKTLPYIVALLTLLISGCGMHSVKDDSPANDLDALVMSVRINAKPVLLPNGKEYCAEEAITESEQDDCLGDLEDGLYNANKKLRRSLDIVEKGVERIKLSRNPCGIFKRLFNPRDCSVEDVK